MTIRVRCTTRDPPVTQGATSVLPHATNVPTYDADVLAASILDPSSGYRENSSSIHSTRRTYPGNTILGHHHVHYQRRPFNTLPYSLHAYIPESTYQRLATLFLFAVVIHRLVVGHQVVTFFVHCCDSWLFHWSKVY